MLKQWVNDLDWWPWRSLKNLAAIQTQRRNELRVKLICLTAFCPFVATLQSELCHLEHWDALKALTSTPYNPSSKVKGPASSCGTQASRRLAHAFGVQFWAVQPVSLWSPFSYFLIVHSTLWASDLDTAEILLLPERNNLFCYPWMPFCWENEKLGNLMKFPTVYVSHQLFLHIVLLIILKGTAILLFRLPTCQWNQLSAFNVHRRDHSRAGSRNKRGCLIFLIPWRMRYFMEVYFSGQPKLLP